MIEINKSQQEELYELCEKMTDGINKLIEDIASIVHVLDKSCNTINIESYLTSAIRYKLEHSECTLTDALSILKKLKSEVECMKLSTYGLN